MKVYLAHSGHEVEQGKEIQAALESIRIEVVNPFDKENEQKAGALWENGHVVWSSDPDMKLCQWIIERDHYDIRTADAVVMIYPAPGTVTIGTPCEMQYAHLIGVPLYIYVPEEYSGHPWIRGMATKLFTDMFELLEYMDGLMK